MKKISLLKLFWIFFKIGLVLFGGGYAILPFLYSEIAEKEKICTADEITNYYALSQCIPGLIAGNVSMFVGYKARSILGAFFALLGICLPAFLAIVIVYFFLNSITSSNTIQNVFDIVDVAVCVSILLTTIELWKHSIVDKFTTFIFVLTIILSILKISPYFVIIIAGLLGLIKYVFYTKYTIAKENTNG